MTDRPSEQAQAYYADGKTPIPESELDAALQAGQANYRKDADVIMKDDSGRVEVVKGSDVGKWLGSGFKVELPSTQERQTFAEEHSTAEQQAIGYLEAGGRGLTGGVSDAGLVALGVDPRGIKGRRENLSVGAMLAELGGAVAPALVSGGSSLAARGITGIGRAGLAAGEAAGGAVARSLGGGIGARVAGGVVGGAVEGALFGAGQGVSDAVLNEVDPEEFAEKVLASAGSGALMGGALGGIGGAFTRRMEGPLPREVLEAGSERSAAKAAMSDVPSAMESAREAAAITKGGYGAAKTVKALEQGMGTIAESLGAVPIAKPLANAARQVEQAARFGREVIEGVGGSATVADRAVVRAAAGADQKLLSEAERIGEASIANTARKHNLTGFNFDKQATQAAKLADDSQRTLDRIAKAADDAGARVDAGRFVADTQEQLASLRKIDDSEAQSLAKSLSKKLAPIQKQVEGGKQYSLAEWTDLRKRFNEGVPWDKLAAEGKSSTEFRSILDRFDEGTESALGREVADTWRTVQRERRDLEFLSRSMGEQAKKHAAEGNLISLQTLVGGDAGIGMMGGLLAGAPVAGMAMGAAKNVANKAVARYGDVFKAKLLDVASGADMGLGRAATTLVQGAKTPLRVSATYDLARSEPNPTKLEGQRLEERYREAESEIRTLQDPEVMATRMSRTMEALGDSHPQVAAAIMAQTQRAVDYLASLVPTDLADDASLTPHLEAGYIHPEQMQQLLSAKWGVDSPFSVIDGIAEGDINWDAIRAVKVVYPRLYTRLQELAVQEAATREEPLAYNQRVLIGLALELPADQTLEPDTLRRIQAARFLPPEASEEGKPGPKPRRGIDISSQYELPNPS